MSLQDEIAKYLKSNKFQNEVRRKIGVLPDFGKSTGIDATKILAEKYAAELMNDVKTALSRVQSQNFIDRVRDEYYTEVKYEDGVGWVVELRFNDDAAFSPSLSHLEIYKNGAYLPVIFNNGWDADGTVYGYWATHGIYVRSLSYRKSSNFIQQAVDAFNKRHSKEGIRASYNPVYDGAGDDWLDYLDGTDWKF